MNHERDALSFGRELGAAWLVGLLGLAGCVFSFVKDRRSFAHGYLIGFSFWVSVAIGLLAILMLQYVVRSVWGQRSRPWLEATAGAWPVLVLGLLPLFFCLRQLYPWTDPELVARDAVLQHKRAYLNVPGFVLRSLAYLLSWSVIAGLLARWARHEPELEASELRLPPRRVRLLSGLGLIWLVLSGTFAAIDWLRSLMPHWYSTSFGLYVLMGAQLSGFAVSSVALVWLRRRPGWQQRVDARCLHDLGKLMFASVTLWAYIAFTQYLIIWSGGLPEETEFYSSRLHHGYEHLALALMIGHFALPFALLLPKRFNQTPAILAGLGGWLLAMRFVDLYWVVAPSYGRPGPPLLAAVAPTLALGGFWAALVLRGLSRRTHALPPSPTSSWAEAA
jgi:hypothetical protein